MTLAHFWTRRPEGLGPWDPETEPERHANGYGHAFLELYWRLKGAGRAVTLGSTIDPHATAVVVSLEELAEWQPRIPARMSAHLSLAVARLQRTPSVILIRNDASLSVKPPEYTTLELMPTQTSIEHERQAWLPLLPQRGIRPRDPRRGATLATVALKAYSYNVPAWCDDAFRVAAAKSGFELRIDDEDSGLWHDFTDVDAVLCVHPSALDEERRKPATKLVNAWRAAAIPICADYVGYREIGLSDVTMLIAENTADGMLRALHRLRTETGLAERLRASLPSVEYSPDAIADRYWQAFETALPARRVAVMRSGARALGEYGVTRLRRRR